MSRRSSSSPSLWTVLPQRGPAPCDHYKHGCCSYGGNVFMLGGRESHSLRDFWRWRWVPDTAMTHLDCMYLFGGLMGLREQRELWRWKFTSHSWSCLKAMYSFTTWTWRKLAVLPKSNPPPHRIHHCCAALGPSYQPAVTSTTSTTLIPSITIRNSLDCNLRPFKNKMLPFLLKARGHYRAGDV
ncbi:unnamed protein product [Coregonus sp. 'balchen']|nr:unnamed protein product [Coregonus sp. 'balchen']